ncbi:aminotransferase class I/II-fold pyridoxal phosphate-dependent enzyme [Desulfovibrio sp. OttesenSCG-928-I05]|nr:aminotransferase class I/II-fold pyridoxal phosphate-dependent enzyme [Desulfovibrio sp. OttesenSCG-928-I05]
MNTSDNSFPPSGPRPAANAGGNLDLLSLHGGDILAQARKYGRRAADFIDFSSNTHVFAEDVTARLIRETPVAYAIYPDSDCTALVGAISAHEELDPGRVLVGNGSADLIWLFMTAMAPRKVLLLGPMFSEYARVCVAFGIPYEVITPPPEQEFICGSSELRRIWDSDADLAVVCCPNNPAAVAYPNIQELFGVLRVPRVLVDNTYREFLWGEPEYSQNSYVAYSKWVRSGVALFTMNSFTKFYACPGIRLGYLLGGESQIRRLARIRPPWSVSSFAQDMGLAFLANMAEYRERLAPMRMERVDMARQTRRMECFNPDFVFEGPSFITAGLLPGLSSASLREKLLEQGLIVRDCDSIPGMPSGFIRFQVRFHRDNELLMKSLGWYAERGW